MATKFLGPQWLVVRRLHVITRTIVDTRLLASIPVQFQDNVKDTMEKHHLNNIYSFISIYASTRDNTSIM